MALPASLAAHGWAEAPGGEPETGDVSARFEDGLIYLRAAANGGPEGVFLLDTGAGATVLDARYAARTQVKLGDPMTIHGGGGVRGARQGEDVRLRLSGGQTGLLDPTVADLSAAARGMGQRLDGILGDDFLKAFVLVLNYRDGRVALRAPQGVVPPADAVRVRLVRTPFILARVHKGQRSAEAEFQIDTGSNTALDLWRPFTRAAFPDARGFESEGLGVAGETRSRKTRMDLLEAGGRRIAGPEANLDDDTRPDDADARYGGVIGNPAWAGLVVTLDFPRQRFWVR